MTLPYTSAFSSLHETKNKTDRSMKNLRYAWLLTLACVMSCTGCGRQRPPQVRTAISNSQGSVTIHGDVWADNWFALYVGDKLLIEDSVSITTERSFNAESFSFKADYPIVLNFVLKDFKENDSGLEYIGTKKQQLGDGGFIAQFKDSETGQTIAATSANWRCLVLHHGPVDESCAQIESPVAGEGPCAFRTIEEPEDWMSIDFPMEEWSNATEFSESEVRPKDGYDRIAWDSAAKLIWSEDLKKDNTILFRMVIESPVP